ncbi:hypothetical protein [Spirosoma litoris]
MATAYIQARFKDYNQETGAIIADEIVTLVYDPDAKDCATAEAPFKNLTVTQARALRALCSTVAPNITADQKVIVRDCGGSTDPGTDPGTTSDDEPAINTDLSGETDVTYYDAQ